MKAGKLVGVGIIDIIPPVSGCRIPERAVCVSVGVKIDCFGLSDGIADISFKDDGIM
jgi:hypothetical protein